MARTRRKKAALLRDLGMGTYIDAGEGKRISQGGMFSRETADKYEPEEEDEDEGDEVNGVVMSYAPSVSIVSPSSLVVVSFGIIGKSRRRRRYPRQGRRVKNDFAICKKRAVKTV